MAKVIAPLNSQGASGQIGQVCFVLGRSGTSIGGRPCNHVPRRGSAVNARARFQSLITAWKQLSAAEVQAWADSRLGTPHAFQNFLACNQNALAAGYDQLQLPDYTGAAQRLGSWALQDDYATPELRVFYATLATADRCAFLVKISPSTLRRRTFSPNKLALSYSFGDDVLPADITVPSWATSCAVRLILVSYPGGIQLDQVDLRQDRVDGWSPLQG